MTNINWKRETGARLASLKLAPAREAEIVEELAQHLEDRYAELLSGGAAPEEAYRAALAELSESESLERELRRVERKATQDPVVLGADRRTNTLGDLLQDLRYGWRALRRSPGFTAVAALTLALGIGANTAVFSLLNNLAWRELKATDPASLVSLHYPSSSGGAESLFLIPVFERLRADNRVFTATLGWLSQSLTAHVADEPADIVRVGFYFRRVQWAADSFRQQNQSATYSQLLHRAGISRSVELKPEVQTTLRETLEALSLDKRI